MAAKQIGWMVALALASGCDAHELAVFDVHADRSSQHRGQPTAGENILEDPGFDEIEDGAFVHWYSPIEFRTPGTPDRRACKVATGSDICAQEAWEWRHVPVWSEIGEAGFVFKCDGQCTGRIDVAIPRTENGTCEGEDGNSLQMTDGDGNPLAFGYGADWWVANVGVNDVCVYLQFYDVGPGWSYHAFTLDLPDRPIASFAATTAFGANVMWMDDAVLALEDFD